MITGLPIQDYSDQWEKLYAAFYEGILSGAHGKTNIVISVSHKVRELYGQLVRCSSVRYQTLLGGGLCGLYSAHQATTLHAECLSSYQQPDTFGFHVTLSLPSYVLSEPSRERLGHTVEAQILQCGSLVKRCC